ncbi:MAG: hypothetical protein ABNO60_00065 [Candidatus Shikimatogenerans sp. Tcar]|uniref:Uncharacterized protein n=1 Tax=Candidatus Shikimatogenerans sp. Tcar TaxID=3158565 RepID=A0AAU7QS63_9FLAO
MKLSYGKEKLRMKIKNDKILKEKILKLIFYKIDKRREKDLNPRK